MFNKFFTKRVVNSTQKYIDQLKPKVNINLHDDVPMPSARLIKKMAQIVSKINGMEDQIIALSDDQLKEKTKGYIAKYNQEIEKELKAYRDTEHKYHITFEAEQREAVAVQLKKDKEVFLEKKQAILDEILPEAFAVMRETGKRVLNMRHYDVQMIGGMVLHKGNIAEMTTGEGKTLVATLPAYLNALTGEGVHVVTVNDYLAQRDRDWMAPLFEFHGLTVGCIQHDLMPAQRQREYGCDITYGTNNEFGFDFLRDNMVTFKEEMVQRPHHFAIVDEVDSILVDEARTPLIISGPAAESTGKYVDANKIAKQLSGKRTTDKDEIEAKRKEIDLSEGVDYLADEKNKSISLTDAGEEKAAKMFGVDNLHDMETIEYRHHVLQSLKAKEFFERDVDYVVRDGQVVIVDEFTGRMMPGRRWSDGLHQAVEAKEGIKIQRENQTLATITFQNYFRLYDKLSGMTGTAYTEANEFKQIYDLDTIVIPTNRKMQRINFQDAIYRSQKEKYNAIIEDINEYHQKGQPVLVGTISIEKSELLSKLLANKGIKHQVLNAKFHGQEAKIIAQAGRKGAVTIATNMAGRGTDIVLGGNPTFLAQPLIEEKAKDIENPEELEEFTQKTISKYKQETDQEHDEVIDNGGLHVIGTERHESRRIDNQLRGRQGRQGDPGSSRFFISLEDDLMRLFASEKIIGIMDKLGMDEGTALEHPMLTNQLEGAQKRVERHNFDIRKHLLEYDNVMNKQREVIYDLRKTILEGEDIKDYVIDAIEEVVPYVIDQHVYRDQEDHDLPYDYEALKAALKNQFNYELAKSRDELKDITLNDFKVELTEAFLKFYEAKEADISSEQLRHIERMVLLHTIDSKWKDHLYAMDQLKEGIGLRSYGQRDPVMEYKKEGFFTFKAMYESIKDEVVHILFKLEKPKQMPQQRRSVFSSIPKQAIHQEAQVLGQGAQQTQTAQAGGEGGQQPARPQPVKHDGPKVGRNDPCPCGSGKKYKKCCGA